MMRTVSLFVVMLSAVGGLWIVLRGDFYLPNRFDPSLATHFAGLAARLLGAALIALAAAGVNFMRHMASGMPVARARQWQWRQFVLVSLTIILFTAAFIGAEVVPNPDHRPAAHARADRSAAQTP
ncbi:hypothetical protein G3580_02655 [Nitrogeniibacter mangrovi]|uniref:Uncharacterized protein n=1 Tax=Nitrogeniibacter mangrovi TaxID=2016596 RepID=A0A6C1AZS1_9RHOO|nr:hypothetical protein [Nitrogeniibacter mangrovi]QID16623.1 hypothetical protein G3580_02655 [Nitrogeniibacter mangrovi]